MASGVDAVKNEEGWCCGCSSPESCLLRCEVRQRIIERLLQSREFVVASDTREKTSSQTAGLRKMAVKEKNVSLPDTPGKIIQLRVGMHYWSPTKVIVVSGIDHKGSKKKKLENGGVLRKNVKPVNISFWKFITGVSNNYAVGTLSQIPRCSGKYRNVHIVEITPEN